jgi:hypothetical protein
MDDRTGMTFTPGIAYDENGQEVVDFDNPIVTTIPDLHWKDYQADVYFDETDGEYHLQEQFDYLDPDDPNNYYSPDAQIADSILEAFPQYQDAVQLAAATLPPQVIEQFDEWIDNHDWDNAMPFIEQMIETYENSEWAYEDDGFDFELEGNIPQQMGMEQAYECLNEAQYEDDPVERDGLVLLASYHDGTISDFNEVIQVLMDKYGFDAVEQLLNDY